MTTLPNTEYTIEKLERESNTKTRTIRFYISEGLLDPPQGNGPSARYNEDHLLRLKVIDHLKRKMKLNEIKKILSDKKVDLRAVVAEAEAGKLAWDTSNLKKMVSPPVTTGVATGPRNFSFSAIGKTKTATDIFSKTSHAPEPEHETWQRLRPVDGIEVQIREDIDQKTRELVMQLINQLRK